MNSRSGRAAPGDVALGAQARLPVGLGDHCMVHAPLRSQTWRCWGGRGSTTARVGAGAPLTLERADRCARAAVGGHLHVLQWAQEHHCPRDEETCARAALGGHLVVCLLSMTLVPGLAKRVAFLAWQHRGDSPVMLVQTYPEDTDISAPRVSVAPRSKWETEGFWGDSGEASENLRVTFSKAAFSAQKCYLVVVVTEHPGSETWPMQLTELGFPHDAATMERMVSAADWSEMDAPVRLTGLRGAAHLNGQEGVIRGEDSANSQRVAVCLADGSEVNAPVLDSSQLDQRINQLLSYTTITATTQSLGHHSSSRLVTHRHVPWTSLRCNLH